MTHRIPNSVGRVLLFAALLSPFVPGKVAAQTDSGSSWSVGVNGEIVSRYLWRGLLLDRGGIQPDVHVEHGNLTVGVWSAWGLWKNGDTESDVYGSTYQEIDTYLSWDQGFGAGDLTLTGTDYYYPYLPGDAGSFSNFKGVKDGEATGAHTLELAAEFAPSAVPLSFMVAWNAYNDPDHALYAQVNGSVTVPVVDIDLDGDIGFLLKDSPNYYGNLAGHAMEYTLKATRSFSIAGFEPYVSAAVTRAPAMGTTYGVFAIGF